MALSDRKIQILQAIINDYIETAEPVGSRTIAKKYNLGISSALKLLKLKYPSTVSSMKSTVT